MCGHIGAKVFSPQQFKTSATAQRPLAMHAHDQVPSYGRKSNRPLLTPCEQESHRTIMAQLFTTAKVGPYVHVKSEEDHVHSCRQQSCEQTPASTILSMPAQMSKEISTSVGDEAAQVPQNKCMVPVRDKLSFGMH